MEKPRVINGICEFCGVDAETCMHSVEATSVPSITKANAVSPKRKALQKGAGSLKKNKKIADIIIPHHDRHDHLENCLSQLPNDVFNIIVVSGGSFAENCNKGVRLATTNNVIILNDDVLPKVDLLLKSLEMGADIVGFYQYIPDEDRTTTGIKYELNKYSKLVASLAGIDERPHLPAGFCLRVKKDAWDKIGGFDEIFINGSEDHDFSLKALKLGLSIDYITEPMKHKHSQSAGRFEHTVKNRDLLNEKWSDLEIIELLNLNKQKYKILLTNNHLYALGGSETWIYTMAKEFERQGHSVDIYTREEGELSELLGSKKLNELEESYDLILVNHNTCLKDIKNIRGFKIFTSHGIFPPLEQVEVGADAYVGISQEIVDFNKDKGYDLELIHNPVDCCRFSNRKPINKEIKNVLSLGKTEEANEIIREACYDLGINFVSCRGKFDIENAINDADLVVTLGRGAYEAMACGRPVIVFDWRHYLGKALGDGYVDATNRDKFLYNNLSGRYSDKEFDKDDLIRELKKYDYKQSDDNREFSKKTFSSKKIAQQYLDILKRYNIENRRFKFVNSSATDYGIAKQLEKRLISNGWELADNGITICYANDLGEIIPEDGSKRTLDNSSTLRRAVYSGADHVFYSQKTCSKYFTKDNAYYLPSAVNDLIFYNKRSERSTPIGFVGKIMWPERRRFVEELENNYEGIFIFRDNIFFSDLADFYNDCKIVVNHSVVNEINMRMFEATACGALLITQDVPYLDTLWELGKEIVVYKDKEEMHKLIKYYLEHEDEAKKIAKAGNARTMKDHKYSDRIKIIGEKICS